MVAVTLRLKRLQEKAAFVPVASWFDQKQAGKTSLFNLHEIPTKLRVPRLTGAGSMDAKYRIHSLLLEIDFVEELPTAKVIARDAGRSRRIALGMAKAMANPIEILAECRIADS